MEHNQVEPRKDMNDMESKMDQMLEALLAKPKNNLQHAVMENDNLISGFIAMTNPMYDLSHNYAPSQVKVPTQPQHRHITISNEVLVRQENPAINIDDEDPQ